MEDKVKQILTRIQIMSAIIWAILLIISGYNNNENISIILMSGAFAELILLSSSIREIKKKRL